MSGTLWVVATPIGNLEDITVRALSVLREVDRILCEDTRRTRALLEALEIPVPAGGLVRCDAHAERERRSEMLGWLAAGEAIALVSDAGTPGLNDPGALLVRDAAAAGHRVSPVPGPSALAAALSVSGMGGSGFTFGGFVPKKADALRTRFAGLSPGVHAFFVPARDLHQLMEALALLPSIGDVFVARELTKLHESAYRGDAQSLRDRFAGDGEARLGEAVVIFEVSAAPTDDAVVEELLNNQLSQGRSPKAAVEAVAGALGLPKRRVYQLMLGIDRDRQ